MKLLTRYLLRAHIGPFFFAFVALTGVILINTLAKELASLAGKGLPLSVVVEFFVLSLPANIALTMPMAVLVAVLHTFSSLAAENEITALRASGVDLRRAALPLIFTATFVAGAMVWFNNVVLPAANYRWRILMVDVAQTRSLLFLRAQTINPIPGPDGTTPYYLEARELDPNTGLMRTVSIYDVSDPPLTRMIEADSGRMAFNSQRTDLLLTLFDGTTREVNFEDMGSFQRIDFRRHVMRMDGVSSSLERTAESGYRTDRDMTLEMMRMRIDSLRSELRTLDESMSDPAASSAPSGGSYGDPALARVDVPQAYNSLPQASDAPVGDRAEPTDLQSETERYAEARARNLLLQIRQFQVEMHKKFAIATATLVFVLIGIPLALRFPRGGIGMVIAVSLSVFGVYYVGLIGGETLGDKGLVPAGIAMWGTNLLFGALGLLGFLRLGREQGTVRGRGWGDLPSWLRLPRFRRHRAKGEA